jgi:hypothetical protein
MSVIDVVAGWIRDAGLEAKDPRSTWVMPGLALHLVGKRGE